MTRDDGAFIPIFPKVPARKPCGPMMLQKSPLHHADDGSFTRLLDVTLVVLFAAAIFLAPWQYDEGWVVLTIGEQAKTGIYSYVIDKNNAPYSLCNPWFYFLDLLSFPELGLAHVYVMRLPGFVLALLGWRAIKQSLADLKLTSNSALVGAAVVWLVTTPLFLITLRVESAYVPMLAIALRLALRWILVGERRLIGWGLLLSIPAPAIHPNGLLVPLTLLAALPFAHGGLTRRDLAWLLPGFLAAIASVLLVLWDKTPAEFLEALQAARNGFEHNREIGDEIFRYVDLYLYAGHMAILYAIALVVGCIFAFLSRSRPLVFAAVHTLGLAIYLLFLPAKWHWYCPLFAPSLSILLAGAMHAASMGTATGERRALLHAVHGLLLFVLVMGIFARLNQSIASPGATYFKLAVIEPWRGEESAETRHMRDVLSYAAKGCVAAEAYLHPFLQAPCLVRYDQREAPRYWLGLAPASHHLKRWPQACWRQIADFTFESDTIGLYSSNCAETWQP
jgi:hypothetical protein